MIPAVAKTSFDDLTQRLTVAREALRYAPLTVWVDDMRQDTEQRLGVEAGDMGVIDDPGYLDVMDILNDVVAVEQKLKAVIERLDRIRESEGGR